MTKATPITAIVIQNMRSMACPWMEAMGGFILLKFSTNDQANQAPPPIRNTSMSTAFTLLLMPMSRVKVPEKMEVKICRRNSRPKTTNSSTSTSAMVRAVIIENL